jgi:hypothetical protein
MKKIYYMLFVCFVSGNLYSQNLLEYKNFKNSKVIHNDVLKADGTASETELPDIGLTGNLLTSFNGKGINPNVIFKGSYKNEPRKEFYDLELCFLKNQNDSLKIDNAIKVFVPELSDYAINFWYTRILNENWALNGFASFGTKGLSSIDSTKGFNSLNTGVFSLKAGFEHRLASDFLSIYGNVNYVMVATDKNNYNKYFGKSSENQFLFVDFGVKFKITDGPLKGIFVNFSALVKTDKMKTIYNNDDAIIPIMKIGLERYLHFE